MMNLRDRLSAAARATEIKTPKFLDDSEFDVDVPVSADDVQLTHSSTGDDDPFGDLSDLRIGANDPVDTKEMPETREVAPGVHVHTLPRKTIVDMITNTPFNQEYAFYTRAHKGHDYVFAIRAVLSRVRKQAQKQDLKLKNDAKLYTLKIETVKVGDITLDRVVLMRSQSVNQRFNLHFEELAKALM